MITVYGEPKTGKTTLASELSDVVVFAFEKGLSYVKEVDHYLCDSAELFEKTFKELMSPAELEELRKKKYIVIDTFTSMEYVFDDQRFYPKNQQAAKLPPKTAVTTLANGLGWGLLREKILGFLEWLRDETDATIIILAHIKDKLVNRDTGEIVQSAEIEARGKLGALLCSYSDAVGKLFRNENSNLIISFKKDNVKDSKLGSRVPKLDGQEFNLGSVSQIGKNFEELIKL